MIRKNPESKGYPEFSQFDLPAMEKVILEWWKENKIFERSVTERPDDNRYVFYEGPPSANGMPGIHHVMSRTIKDMFCRIKTLQGYRVERKAGWDTHGLPVELGVEKQLGITKKDIGTKISVAEYNNLCRQDVMKFTDIWNDLTQKMGYWVDLEHPYITYENEYIESLWALLKKLYDKGLLYKGYTIQPYSPAAGTGLSSHELNQPGCYREVKDLSAVAMFKVKKNHKSAFLFDNENEDVRILAWTTTPWTLPSNVALAVGAEVAYTKIKTVNFYSKEEVSVIIADVLADGAFAWNNLPINERKPVGKGSDLAGIHYEQLLPYVQPEGDAFRVIVGDFVTTSDGTGVVHIAPSFGADDMRVAKQNGIGGLTLVDRQGRFVEEVTDFPLEYVKEAYYTDEEKAAEAKKQGRDVYLNVDIRIVDKLKKENKLFKSEKYEHNYPHCWRTDKPVIYYPLDSWFIKTTAVKDRLIELNKTINWQPASTGEGRFGQWLENLVDWNLSRSRYWGTPLPIWRTEDGTEEKCIGSIEELETEMQKAVNAGLMTMQHLEKHLVEKPVKDDIVGHIRTWKVADNTKVHVDLHKPYVDDIILVSKSGKPMYREADLIDVWFDSGAMPYAQWHYPLENEATFKKNFPADFIAEGVDQTRGWFFTLHVLAVALFDSVAYKNVVSNGLLLDKNGNKMSKRLGNVVDPFDTLAKFGADATRWYMMRNSDPWDNMKFDIGGLQDVQRSHFGTLYNTYGFFALYANIDNFVIDEMDIVPVAERTELDRWIISKLHSLVKEVTSKYNTYDPMPAARAIETFVDSHLSNWYVRLSRRRFWKGEMSRDKRAAYETLYECLNVVAQLMSPVSPFFSEWLYKNLTDLVRDKAKQNNTPLQYDSIHLTYLTNATESAIDLDLEERMEMAQQYTSMVLSLRKKTKIKVRQPLAKMLIPVSGEDMKAKVQKMESYILSEVNVKQIEYVTDTEGVVKKKIKPNFRELGKKVGGKMKALQNAIAGFTQDDIIKLEREKTYALDLEGEQFMLNIADAEIVSEDIPGWLVANEGAYTVALDVNITEELRNEGNAREFVNKVQNIRKEKDFQVLDRIRVKVVKEPLFEAALTGFKDYISNEILAKEIELVDSLPEFDEVDMNETMLKVSVNVAN